MIDQLHALAKKHNKTVEEIHQHWVDAKKAASRKFKKGSTAWIQKSFELTLQYSATVEPKEKIVVNPVHHVEHESTEHEHDAE
jgi:hypothetical protein